MIPIEDWRRSGISFEFRGHRLRFYEGGRAGGETLLLIHGFPTAAWDWHRLWGPLGERFRLLAPDLLGYGFSDKPRNIAYSFALQADICEALLRHRCVDRFHVLAHDYGDTVAQELLARRNEGPDRGLASVCLLNGGIFPERQQPRPIQRMLAGPLGPLLCRLISRRQAMHSLSEVFGPQTRPDEATRCALWQMMDYAQGRRVMPQLLSYLRERMIYRDRWVGALVDCPLPLMFIDGTLDPVSGANMVARWRELLPGAGLEELPGIGHYPQLEAPESVLAVYLPFLQRAIGNRQKDL